MIGSEAKELHRDATVGSQTPSSESAQELYARCKAHVLAQIAATPVGKDPFYHLFIENIFPDDFYNILRAHMLTLKYGDSVQDRTQDSAAFTNKRCNLYDNTDDVVECVRSVFSDPDVKLALLKKFYVAPPQELVDALAIHREFEYTFTKGGRFQNIHVDIPPKYMSFVFYIPEHPMQPVDQGHNATILYDKDLKPHHKARFQENSLCIFVPHFFSYHGFASTLDRDVLLIFYVNKNHLQEWQKVRQGRKEEPPFTDLREAIEAKLRRYPLIEYADGGEERLIMERDTCLVNAPQGRVMVDENGKATLPKAG